MKVLAPVTCTQQNPAKPSLQPHLAMASTCTQLLVVVQQPLRHPECSAACKGWLHCCSAAPSCCEVLLHMAGHSGAAAATSLHRGVVIAATAAAATAPAAGLLLLLLLLLARRALH
jgi:hypothetical protein